ncbi:MAG TPA: MFS transporter, partial [Solirubrobacteraceae bacterium]
MSATATSPDIRSVPSAGATAASAATRLFAARWIVLAVVLAADVMDLIDATIVNVAGPTIRHDLGGGASTLQWLGAAYTLTFAVLLVTGARLGDIFGRRRLFLIGSAGFTAMSAACALAPSPEILIGLRALQGGFGALVIPQGFGLIKEVFPEDEMSKVFATFGPVMGLSAIVAPILAGVLIDADLLGTGWRMVFLINVPVGIAALAAAVKVLPRGAATPGTRLDLIGMVLLG